MNIRDGGSDDAGACCVGPIAHVYVGLPLRIQLHEIVWATDGCAAYSCKGVGSTTAWAIDGTPLPLVRSLGGWSARLSECRDGEDIMESLRGRWTRVTEAYYRLASVLFQISIEKSTWGIIVIEPRRVRHF